MAARHFMATAVKHPGALRRKAKAAHMTTSEFAHKHEHDKGITGRQARLAIVFEHARRKRVHV